MQAQLVGPRSGYRSVSMCAFCAPTLRVACLRRIRERRAGRACAHATRRTVGNMADVSISRTPIETTKCVLAITDSASSGPQTGICSQKSACNKSRVARCSRKGGHCYRASKLQPNWPLEIARTVRYIVPRRTERVDRREVIAARSSHPRAFLMPFVCGCRLCPNKVPK